MKNAQERRKEAILLRSASVNAGKKNKAYPSSLGLQKSPITFSFFGSEV